MRRLNRLMALLVCVLSSVAGRSLWASEVSEEQAVAAICERGGTIYRDTRSPQRPIVKVDFSGARIDAATISQLSAFDGLRCLCLGNTDIVDEDLLELRELTGLTELALYETGISDAGLEHLKPLTKLRKLHLGHTRITDSGLDQLKGLVYLRYLALGRTGVSDAKIREIGTVLPNCTISHPVQLAAKKEP